MITTGRVPHRTGYTGTALFSLSMDPERLVISVARTSSSYSVIRDTGAFAVNILRADQQAIAERFSGRDGLKGEQRFSGSDWTLTNRGASLLSGALGSIECAVEEVIERHSHALFIGTPLFIRSSDKADGLIYWRAGYSSTSASTGQPSL